MRKILLFVALVLMTVGNNLLFAQTVTPAAPLQLCPDNNYDTLATISIIETLPTDFLPGESDVTYSILLPAGFKFEPFTGNVFLSDSFTSGTFTVFPDSVFITYSLNLGSGNVGGIDSIIISGLKVRTSSAGLASADIDRGGSATHASNGPGVNSHGSLSSGQALTGISLTSTNITCNGVGDGTITVNITTGNAPYDYSIDFGSSYPYPASPITSLAGGGYIVTVRDNLGCVANSSNVAIINEPSVITENSVVKTDISCNGGSDGTLTATASGGTGAINYSINGIAGPFDSLSGITTIGLGNGTYDIYFEDANGCQLDGTDVTINEPTVITPAAATKNDITCNGLSNGTLTANASGGTGTIQYSINGLAGPFNTMIGNQVSNLANATYDIYFQDANGCQVDGADVTINEPSAITETSAIRTNVSCNAGTDGTITAIASGGTGAIVYSLNGSGAPFTPSGGTATGLSPGAYSVYYRDANNCVVTGSSLSITEPNALAEVSISKTDISCNNANDGTINALASGGTNPIQFSVNGSGGTYVPIGSTVNSLTPGIKDIYFEDANGCQLDGTDQNIINPAAISISAPTPVDPTFVGGSNGSITFGSVSGGTGAYNYSIDNGSNYQTSPFFNNLSAGNYTLRVRDANLCSSTFGVVALNDPGNITGGQVEFFNGYFDTTICNGSVTPLTIYSDTIEPTRDSLRWEVSTNGVSWSKIMTLGTDSVYIINGPHTNIRFYRRQTYQGGDVATSNIVQRSINNGNTILITIPQPVICIEDGNQTISANPAPIPPASGVLSLISGSGLTDNGNGTADFNPLTSGAGTFTIDYNYTNEFGCISSNTANITVNENTSVSFIDQTDFLTTDPPFTLTGGSPLGGTYFGPGVFGNKFFPGLTGADSFDLTYTQIDANGCSDTDTLTVTVSNVTFGDILGEEPQYCSDEPLDTIIGVAPTDGTPINFVSIPGVLSQIDSVTAVINPNALAGNYTLVFEYQIGASVQNVTTDIRIDPAPVATLITNGSTVFCENDISRSLTGAGTTPNPVTQTFLGNGIISDDGLGNAVFNAGAAGSAGSPHPISFVYEDINGCNDTATASITVNPLPPVGFVITEPFTGDTLTDMKFCKNEDSLILKSNQSAGVFESTNNVALDNSLGGGQAVFRPSSTQVGASRNIYYYYQDANNCVDTFEMNVGINLLPNNFDYSSTPSAAFDPNVNVINEFCTEDDSVLLTAFFSGFGKEGIGFFKMDPPGNGIGGIDTTVFSSSDSVYFRSILQSGSEYDVRYIYTDTTTGCTDSISRKVRIASEPSLRVQLLNYPGSPSLSNTNNDTMSICTNGDFIRLQGFNDSLPGPNKEVDFNQSLFTDSIESSAIDIINFNGDDYYIFNPDSASALGLHILQFDYTSNLGCKDKFTFTLDVLDTPSLDIVIDTNVIAFNTTMPELCQSVDTLTFQGFSNSPGYGTMWISKQNPISPELDSDTLRDGINDTLLISYPSSMLNYTQSRVYFANYLYVDTTTSEQCKNEIRQPFRINPLPNEQFVSQDADLEYCNYAELDTFSNLGMTSFLDTNYFIGPGFSKVDTFRYVLDPSLITPDTTDQGTTVNFWYVFRDNNLCVDSISSSYTVHPTPQFTVDIKEQGTIEDQFCISNTLPVQIETNQLNGTLTGVFSYRFEKISTSLNQPSFQPSNLFIGRDTLIVNFRSFAGCSDTVKNIVYIYNDPAADFNVNEFCIIDPIQFFDNSTLNSDSTNLPDSIVSWSWQFTQFNTSTAQNPSFDFNQPGLGQNFYNIELEVTNSIGCSDDTDTTFFFGEPPVADFTFDDICATQDILFENISLNDTAVSAANFKWSFSEFPFDQNNLINTFTSDSNILYQFSTPGAYAVRFDLSTSYGCADTITKRLDIRPIIDLSNGNIYSSDFENDSIEWRPGTLSNNFSWEQAQPSFGLPSGSNDDVWVTNADSSYLPLEKSFVEGPCFDFSRVQRPMIVLDYFSDLRVNDGVALQYSKNSGRTWRTVGLEETGINWYNESSISGNPGNQTLGQVGWSIENSGWDEARHQLDELRNSPPMGSNAPFVRLRIAFGSSNTSIGLKKGFAFGNIQIKERDKLTLIEHFTNINNPSARQGDLDHNELINSNRNEYDVLDIQYHTDFPGPDPVNSDNSLEQGARSLFYGVSTIPRTVFEGNIFNNVTATWVSNANFLDDGKHRFIAQRILEDAKFDIDLDVNKTGNSLSGTATFTAKQNLIPGREYTAFIAVIEKFIPINSFPNGTFQNTENLEFRSVFKKFLPQASGTNIRTISSVGESRPVNFSWNYDNVYDSDSIYVVAFIQDNVTREIYQVASDDSTKIWIPNAVDSPLSSKNKLDFKLYPNPSGGTSIIQMSNPAEGKEQMIIYNQMGIKVMEEELITGTKNILINLMDYPAGVYIVQIAHPEYGVKNSRLVITK